MLEGEAEAPSNIAIVKYWGKRGDPKLNLPLNDSFSISLDALKVKTRVTFDKSLMKDEVIINGKKLPEDKTVEYAGKVLNKLREISGTKIYAKVESYSNFPESAGLASSAAGIAALTLASAKALGLSLDTKELSIIARIGSGSACRSVFGGFVIWHAGTSDKGDDSFCESMFPYDHWEELVDIIPIFSEEKKQVSSRQGMKLTATSSALLKCRLDFVNNTFTDVIESVKNRNSQRFFQLTIRHSNSMHAVMLDSFPPLIYLNSFSLDVIRAFGDANIAGYTFDAGPNPHIFTLRKNLNVVKETLDKLGAKKIIISGISPGPRLDGF